MGRIWCGVIALLLAVGFGSPAGAKNMTFVLERTDARSVGLDLYQIIWADGEITASTGTEFRAWAKKNGLIPSAAVYLNSPGGSLIGGLEFGQAIRDLGFETWIGQPDSKPGMCLSACAYAYLGGKFRYLDNKATYGVHRFYGINDADSAQIVGGVLSAYIEKMGAKPRLYQLMTIAGADEILPIPHGVLRNLNVVNDGVASTVWDLRNLEEVGFYLRGTTVTNRGTHKMLFLCNNRALFAMPMLDSPDPDLVSRSTGKVNWIVDEEWLPPLPPDQGRPSSNGAEVSTVISVSKGLYSRMKRASSFGFAWQNINGTLYSGFEIKIESETEKLETFAKTCNSSVYN